MSEDAKRLVRSLLGRLGVLRTVRILRGNNTALKVLICKFRYSRLLKCARAKPRNEKIRVLFIVSEIAKWKEQSVYEAMERSGEFEPIVGLSAWNRQSGLSPAELDAIHTRAEAFFDQLGDRHIRTVRVVDGKKVFCDLAEFNPDVVYYTEPWSPCLGQDPWVVSKFCLTVYTPYFTPNYGRLEWDCHLPLHRMLYGYFCLNEAWGRAFRRSLWCVVHCVKFIPAGHPGLDFLLNARNVVDKGYVIYAPHHSFPHPQRAEHEQNYSTFDWNHQAILAYAKQHPEFNWVFKPHPVLRTVLAETGLMTEAETQAYYDEWAKIGKVCEDGAYQDLFLASRAIITDCGSFLTEYGATGKPVIHLICAKNSMTPISLTKKVYDTYYQVHNLEEMYATFKIVLEERSDPNRELRLEAVQNAGFCGTNAAENIVNHLKGVFGR